MVLVLSILSDGVLDFYQVLSKYLIRFQSYGPEGAVGLMLGWSQMPTDGWTNGWKTVPISCHA